MGYSCKRFRISRTHWRNTPDGRVPWRDGARPYDETELLDAQRAGIHFYSADNTPVDDMSNEDLWIHENQMSRYGIEIHDAKRVIIASNDISDASGHGILLGGDSKDGSILKDVFVTGNLITDPLSYGIAIMDRDLRGRVVDNTTERVRIVSNSIIKDDYSQSGPFDDWCAIRAGAYPPYSAIDLIRCKFKDLIIEDNYCKSATRRDDAGFFGNDMGIRLDLNSVGWPALSPAFLRPVVRGNTIVGFSTEALRLASFQQGAVADNIVFGCDRGVVFTGNSLRNDIHYNRVLGRDGRSAGEYNLFGSLGRNVMHGNVGIVDGRAQWDYRLKHEEATDYFFVPDMD